MPSSEEILTAIRELQPRMPALLDEKSAEVQVRISPLVEQLEAGQSDGAGLLSSGEPFFADSILIFV